MKKAPQPAAKKIRQFGPWPINYINQATKLDVLDDVENFSANVAATRSDVAIMLAETLDQNMVKWVSDDNEFVEKEKNDETYTLLQDSFDGNTVEAKVSAVDVTDAENFEYQISTDKGEFDADADTAVAGVDPQALVNRYVTIIADKDDYAAYVQVDDEIIEVEKAERTIVAKDSNYGKIKLDGKTYSVAADNNLPDTLADVDDVIEADDANKTLYAQINADDEVVECNYDTELDWKLFGGIYLVTDVDTEEEGEYEITVDDQATAYAADDDDVIIIKNGKRITAKDVKAGDLVHFVNDNAEMVSVISDKAITGKVTKYTSTKVTIGGTAYAYDANTKEFNGDYEKQNGVPAWNNLYNKDVTVYVDFDNAVEYVINTNDDTIDNYGILLDKANGSGFDSDKVNAITLYTKEGKSVEFNFKDNAAKNQFAALGAVQGDAVRYHLDNEGDIKSIELVENIAGVEDLGDKTNVINNKYVKVGTQSRVISNDAVIFNVQDDYEVSVMKKADVLNGKTVERGALSDGDVPVDPELKYSWVILNDDGQIEFMAITKFGGETSVDYAIINEVYSYDGDNYITFVDDSTEYELADPSITTENEGELVTYKVSNNEVKNVVEVTDGFNGYTKGTVKSYADGLVTLNDNVTFELNADCVYVLIDGDDVTYTTAAKALKDGNNIAYILDTDETDPTAELVVFFK
ncbi:MAG: hypothetical protein ACOX7J_03540 [Bacillota bacterium]